MLKATRIAKIAAVVLLAGSTLAATTAAQAYVPNVFPQQQRHNWWYHNHNHNYGYPGYGNGYGYPGYATATAMTTVAALSPACSAACLPVLSLAP
jgi:hypothetical protein